MKKSLIVLAALAVLSGCGMNEKTTCTNENKVGNITSKVTYEIEHKNNDVKKVILTYDYRDDHTDGVGTGTDGTTKDKEDNNTTNNDPNLLVNCLLLFLSSYFASSNYFLFRHSNSHPRLLD